MLQPKRMKHRKMMKRTHGGLGGVALRGNTIAFGEYAIRTLEPAWITARQIEAARRTITHHLKRGGKVWIRIFPDVPVTKKPLEVRMGAGREGGVGGAGCGASAAGGVAPRGRISPESSPGSNTPPRE